MLESNNSSALEFMDEFRQNLFVKEVYAFTPKGKLVILPDKATTLDFAFEIHTEITGNTRTPAAFSPKAPWKVG